jgi:hypothetical protein
MSNELDILSPSTPKSINVEIELLPHYPKDKGLPVYQTVGSACFDLYAAMLE